MKDDVIIIIIIIMQRLTRHVSVIRLTNRRRVKLQVIQNKCTSRRGPQISALMQFFTEFSGFCIFLHTS